MKVSVDADLCTGCGLCVDVCPDVFEIEDDLAVVVASDVPKNLEEACEEAAESCPVEAIVID